MSITPSLLFFLLCLSMHACNARHLGVVDEPSRTELHHSVKDAEKMRSLLSKEIQEQSHGLEKGERRVGESPSGATSSEKTNSSKVPLKKAEDNKGTISGGVQIHEKHRDQPGFNLDYSTPKTHPPHHN